jgi:hypothetical protein
MEKEAISALLMLEDKLERRSSLRHGSWGIQITTDYRGKRIRYMYVLKAMDAIK